MTDRVRPAGGGVSTIYCPRCRAPNSIGRNRCKECRRVLPSSAGYLTAGIVCLSLFVAAPVTAFYAWELSARWPGWLRLFGVTDPNVPDTEHFAHEAAYGLGLLIFICVTVASAFTLRSASRRWAG